MHKFLSFIKEFRIPKKQELTASLESFSKKEFYIFIVVALVAFVGMVIILDQLNNKFLVDVPIKGGSTTEGIIGMATLVNPVTAISDADKDLVSLVYSGLVRRMPDGSFIPDLAESYTISPDGLTYTFIIKNKVTFHDGVVVTADDVIFTINKIKDQLIKSPRRIGWEGISVEKIDDKTVTFKLKQPYISFLDNMTLGILPEHIWQNVEDSNFNISPFNIKAIGSGPYKIKSVLKNKDGLPQEYNLKSFSNFTLGTPNIDNLKIISYPNEKDLMNAILSDSVNQAGGISPKNAEELQRDSHTINTASTSRIFGLFYNSSKNKIFMDAGVVKAFNLALDRQEIVDKVLYGYGTVIGSPIPETIIPSTKNAIVSNEDNFKKASDLLDKSGWTVRDDGIRAKGGTTIVNKTVVTKAKNGTKKSTIVPTKVNGGPLTQLAFAITTGDTPELRQSTEIIKTQLEKLGVKVNTQKVYEMGPLNQVIRDRDYEVLFFGQIINHESDLYSFWHSSQKKDPGLNISMYGNAKVDKILEDAQKTISLDARLSKYKDFINEFNKDLPALLIYSPKYLYATSNELNNINLNSLINPSDRFASIYTWYANKDHVWKIFTKQ
ncbi:MAG: ABC transporter substrate-binding protein [Candidatus Paceibacterota bacterium]